MPETPRSALGPLVRETVIVEGHPFVLERPSDTDKILDDPIVQKEFHADEYMPYWADLWPAARMLAKVLIRESWPPGTEALEIGCGLGLPGVVALSKGMRVTFSDYDCTALEFAANNAVLNGFTNFDVLAIDWRRPPEGRAWPVLLASDLIYELRNVEPLVGVIKALLAPGGVCLMTDQDRVPAHALREQLESSGLEFTTALVRAGEPGGRRMKGTLYQIRHGSAASLGSPRFES